MGAGGQLGGYAGKSKVNFGGLMTPRDRFATWDMVRELSQSPLIEIGSHTWDSHYGIPANPQGSREPAIANRFSITRRGITKPMNTSTSGSPQTYGKSPIKSPR